MPFSRYRARYAAPLFLAALTACADQGTLNVAPPAPADALASIACVADVRAGTVRCDAPRSGVSRTIYGVQGVNVRLRSSGVSYSAADSIFQFSVDVENLLPQAIGSTDGVASHTDGIRVFFNDGPTATSGIGDIEVLNADGVGTFTAAAQPYFQYAGNLAPGATSAAKLWRLKLPPNVGTFSFSVFVSAELAPALVINEVMANPAVVADGSGEWIEIYNRGLAPVDLAGWRLASSNDAGHTIASSVVVPAGGYVVLGLSTNQATNGGVPVAYAYSSVTLNNSNSDWVALRTPAGLSHDSVHWGLGASVPNGASRMLISAAQPRTVLMGSGWSTATTTYGGGTDLGTPGAANSGGGTPPPAGTAATIVVTPAGVSLAPGGTSQLSTVVRDSAGQITTGTISWSSTVPAVATVSGTGLVSGVADGTTLVIGTLANGRADTSTVVVTTPSTVAVYRNHVEFGVPSGVSVIVLNKTQYVVGYSPLRGGPAWVSWNLNATHFGDALRCDCFTADATLPDSVYKVVTGDYTGSGYSRGHMVMSEQRTTTAAENQATFLTTNILPQIQDMNGGPWLQFENYSNDLARVSFKEVYNIAGGIYSASPATLNGAGKVQIPTSTWKVIVVMNSGQGLANVASASDIQVYAVNMPNQAGIQSNPWSMYTTTVDAIEAATGLDLLALLPDAIEAVVEAN